MSLQVRPGYPYNFVTISILIPKLVSHLAAIHAKRATVQPKDMQFIREIRKMMTGYEFPGEK